MSPLNAVICTTTYLERQKCYGPGKKILLKQQLFDFEVKGQGPTKVITVRDTPPYGHAPTYQISLTYLQKVIKKNNWSYVKTMSCSGSHLGITINIKNTKFVKDLPKIDAQFRFNQCNSFREEDISVFSRYGPVLIL